MGVWVLVGSPQQVQFSQSSQPLPTEVLTKREVLWPNSTELLSSGKHMVQQI